MAVPRIAALVLAAGRSTRMGADNKMLVDIDGRPMVRRVCEAVLASAARPVIVVSGHERQRLRVALSGLGLDVVDNPHYRDGLSTSLRAGLQALPPAIDGVVIALGDMPWLAAADIDRVIAAFAPQAGREIIVPTHDGKRGNPVLWPVRLFPELAAVSGDKGGRGLLAVHANVVHHVAIGRAALLDVDRPADLPGDHAVGRE